MKAQGAARDTIDGSPSRCEHRSTVGQDVGLPVVIGPRVGRYSSTSRSAAQHWLGCLEVVGAAVITD